MADKVTSVSPAPLRNSESQLTLPEKSPNTKKMSIKPTHPRTAKMVNTAIAVLDERSGSSLQAIKKYIGNTYKIKPEKHAAFIKKYLKSAVISGSLVQTKGKGAAGSFKLSIKPETGKSEVRTGKFTVLKKNVPKKSIPSKKVPVMKSVAKKPTTKKQLTKKLNVKQSKAKIGKAKSSNVPLPKKKEVKKRMVLTKIRKPVPKKAVAMKK